MKIYKVTQDAVYGYDTYDSFVVVAPNEEEARNIHPSGGYVWYNGGWCVLEDDGSLGEYWRVRDWCRPEDVVIELIGESLGTFHCTTVICSSFNAG